MTGRQLAITFHAALLVGALFLIVPWLTTWHAQHGYLLALTVYWLGFCMPAIGLYALPGNDGRLFSERLAWSDWWIPLLLLAQVCVVAIITFVPNTSVFTSGGMWLAILIAAINGPLEEMAWRGGFLGAFRERPRTGFWLGWALYCALHIPLALSHGLAFQGGAFALIGGVAALGLLWSWIAWRTGSVFYVAMAHALTNILVFWLLFDSNGFV
jgi:membrane protease YdiL (CAAX protease family)